MKDRETKLRVADTLLEKGVRVQCVTAPLLFRWFGLKKLNIILRQRPLADLVRISQVVVRMGLQPHDLQGLTLAAAYKVVQAHGADALRILSIASAPTWLPRRWYAWWLGRHLTPKAFAQAWMVFTLTSGVSDFIGSIRLIVMEDNLSPTNIGSTQKDE